VRQLGVIPRNEEKKSDFFNFRQDPTKLYSKTTAQTQPTETSGIKRFTTTKTQKSRTHTAEDDFLKLDHPKNHPEFNESNEILDLLKRVVTKSDRGDGVRSKGTSQSPRRKGKSFNPSQSGTLKFENSQPMTLVIFIF